VRRSAQRWIFSERPYGTLRLIVRLVALMVAVAFAALLAYGLTTKATDASVDEALSRGETLPAPGFDLPALATGRPGGLAPQWQKAAADGRVDLDELRGTPIALNFWASWCDPCRAEADGLERGWRAAERQGVLFIGLNQQDAREEAHDFLRQFAISFPQIRDRAKDTARAWGVTGMPETFFISSNGDVVGHVVGTISEAQMQEGVVAARSGRPVGVNVGGDRRPVR
jgi:cytochrome c biogenesis protein CcmG/thiol:disulfide interchange protein DsbE